MLEVLVCNDASITAELYAKQGVDYNDNSLAIRAMAGEECLGFCLFIIDGDSETVFSVEPREDRMLADGLLRSALHVGCERGITDAFYSGDDYVELYEKIGFIEDKATKRLKLQNLFTDCCSCKKE